MNRRISPTVASFHSQNREKKPGHATRYFDYYGRFMAFEMAILTGGLGCLMLLLVVVSLWTSGLFPGSSYPVADNAYAQLWGDGWFALGAFCMFAQCKRALTQAASLPSPP